MSHPLCIYAAWLSYRSNYYNYAPKWAKCFSSDDGGKPGEPLRSLRVWTWTGSRIILRQTSLQFASPTLPLFKTRHLCYGVATFSGLGSVSKIFSGSGVSHLFPPPPWAVKIWTFPCMKTIITVTLFSANGGGGGGVGGGETETFSNTQLIITSGILNKMKAISRRWTTFLHLSFFFLINFNLCNFWCGCDRFQRLWWLFHSQIQPN